MQERSVTVCPSSTKHPLSFAETVGAAMHDLREPARSAAALCDIFLESHGAELSDQAMALFSLIAGQCERMCGILEGMSELARIGQNKVMGEEVCCADLIGELRPELSPLLERVDGRLVVEDLPVVKGNRKLLRAVFRNLIVNALRFHLRGHAVVVISSYEDHASWHIHVSDNNRPLTPEEATMAFEALSAVPDNTGMKSTGLGLKLCQAIVERHGGNVSHETLPNGNRFSFSVAKAS